MAGINDILRPIVFTEMVSQIAMASDLVLNRYGMTPGGRNELSRGLGREGSYHIYNDVRTVGQGRQPGTAAARSKRNPTGRTPFVIPRMHDSVALLAEELHNLAKIDDPRTRDAAGTAMIARQAKTLAQKAKNWRVAQVIGMLRDSLYYNLDGDSWSWSWTSGTQINFQMPATHKDQINGIITASWHLPGTDIPSQLRAINAYAESEGTGGIQEIDLNSKTFGYVLRNDYIQEEHGIASTPFKEFERVIGTKKMSDGTTVPLSEHVAELKSLPGVIWHISDAGIELGAEGSETFTKFWPDDYVHFSCGDFGQYKLDLGSEPIAEYDGGPEEVKTGFAAWSAKKSDPTETRLYVLDNAIAYNDTPKSDYFAHVANF